MSSSSSSSSGVGLLGLLTVLFVGLKLTEIGVVATWSWWWVLSPLWIGFAVVLFILLAVLLGTLFILTIKEIKK